MTVVGPGRGQDGGSPTVGRDRANCELHRANADEVTSAGKAEEEA